MSDVEESASGSGSGSESDSGSDTSSSSSSSSARSIVRKPIFISKRKGKGSAAVTSAAEADASDAAGEAPVAKSARDIALQKLEHKVQLEQQHGAGAENGDFDGVDDTDNVDVEGEYSAWRARERARKVEHAERIRTIEEEKNDRIRRRDMGGDAEATPHSSSTSGASATSSKSGVFYGDNEAMEKFLKRKHEAVEDAGDHSRPTRFRK